MDIGNLLFGTKGRINRRDWWLGNVFALIIASVLSSVFHLSIPHELSWKMFSLHNITIGMVIGVCFIWMHIALNTKRWHDLSKHGVFTVLNYLPVLGFFVSIFILGLCKGDSDSNEYGDKP